MVVSYTVAMGQAVGCRALGVVPTRPVVHRTAGVVVAAVHELVVEAVVLQVVAEHFVDAAVGLRQPLPHWQLAGYHNYSHSDAGAVAADLTIAVMNSGLGLAPAAVDRVCTAVVGVDSGIPQSLAAVVVGAAFCPQEVVAAWAHAHIDRDLCWDHLSDNARRLDVHGDVGRRVAVANVPNHIHPSHQVYARVEAVVVPVVAVVHRGAACVVEEATPVAAVVVDVNGDSVT